MTKHHFASVSCLP